MSLFSALFGKKKNEVAAVTITTSIPTNTTTEASPSFHLRGKPDSNGLYPSELVMLAVAERYKTTETNFSNYFLQKYEIANAPKMLKSLHSRGFLEIGSPVDMLPSLKVPELKELAAAIGVAVKGKKQTLSPHFLRWILKCWQTLLMIENGNLLAKARPHCTPTRISNIFWIPIPMTLRV